MEELFTLSGLFSLLTLAVMEIVLGIDNILFISIITGKIPQNQRKNARRIGLFLALLIRIALLFSITWLIGLTQPILSLPFLAKIGAHPELSARDCILLIGGLFLVIQSMREIYEKIGQPKQKIEHTKSITNLKIGILQIIIIDVIFSFDSILTAVGLVRNVTIMIAAVVLSMFVMLSFAGKISQLLEKYERFKMLALVFLVCIGCLLVLEAFEISISKGYLYFSMVFSVIIELINIRIQHKHSK